jgi:hypothetical protein
MLFFKLVIYLALMLCILKVPYDNAFIVKITWPIRGLLTVLGFTVLYTSYLLAKLADPRSADVITAGMVNDKISGTFIMRTFAAWRFLLHQKVAFIRYFIPLARSEGLLNTLFHVPDEMEISRQKHWLALIDQRLSNLRRNVK